MKLTLLFIICSALLYAACASNSLLIGWYGYPTTAILAWLFLVNFLFLTVNVIALFRGKGAKSE